MIRFVDLTRQILADDAEPLFAFYNTVPDIFIELDGVQTWRSWEEFEHDFLNSKERRGVDGTSDELRAALARFKSMFPFLPAQPAVTDEEKEPALSDLSQKLLHRTQRLHGSICEFEGMIPPPYGECVEAWGEAVAAMDKALSLTDESMEGSGE